MSHSILFTQQRFVGTRQIWFQTTLSENLEHIQIYIRHGVITAVSCILQEKGKPLAWEIREGLVEKATFYLSHEEWTELVEVKLEVGGREEKRESIPWRRHCLGKTTRQGGAWGRRQRSGQWSQSSIACVIFGGMLTGKCPGWGEKRRKGPDHGGSLQVMLRILDLSLWTLEGHQMSLKREITPQTLLLKKLSHFPPATGLETSQCGSVSTTLWSPCRPELRLSHSCIICSITSRIMWKEFVGMDGALESGRSALVPVTVLFQLCDTNHVPGTYMEEGPQWVQAIRGCIAVENLKAIINPTESQSAFYYHHVLAILNNVSDKIFLPERIFCRPRF